MDSKNEFGLSIENEPSVFKLLRFDCNVILMKTYNRRLTENLMIILGQFLFLHKKYMLWILVRSTSPVCFCGEIRISTG